MDAPTKYLSDYVKQKGINLAKMSRDTEIPYISIYNSLIKESSDRNLRVGEAFKICEFLGIDPRIIASQKEAG